MGLWSDWLLGFATVPVPLNNDGFRTDATLIAGPAGWP
jgi:hypothetical protein